MKTIIHAIILVILYSVIANASSNPPAPGSTDTATHPEGETGHNKQSASKDKRGTKDFPLIIDIGKSPIIQVETKENPNEASDYSSPEWWLVYVTSGLALITFILAFFTGFLWNATRKLVKDAKDTSERQLRAYVNIFGGRVLNINNSENRIFSIDAKNFGQTPAYKISSVYGCIVREYPLDENKPLEKFSSENHKIFSILGPSCEYTLKVLVPHNAEWAEQKIYNGTAAIYCFGEIIYHDAFNDPRFTKFRYICQGDGIARGEIAPYNEGNDAN